MCESNSSTLKAQGSTSSLESAAVVFTYTHTFLLVLTHYAAAQSIKAGSQRLSSVFQQFCVRVVLSLPLSPSRVLPTVFCVASVLSIGSGTAQLGQGTSQGCVWRALSPPRAGLLTRQFPPLLQA